MIAEIAPDVFRVSLYVPEIDLEFSHFVVRDDEPLLFHTGLRSTFEPLLEEVARILDPSSIRWISFSHFESDECGALNQWLGAAPRAEAVSGLLGSLVNLNDFANRPPRMLQPDEPLHTGRYRFRFVPTPHVPHGWDAGVLFEETEKTLFCSDLFHQWGLQTPVTSDSIIERARETLIQNEAGPFANYIPYNENTGRILEGLARLEPRMLAVMHGSSYLGDGATALRQLNDVMAEVLRPGAQSTAAAPAA